MRVGTWTWRVAALLLAFASLSLAQPAAYAQFGPLSAYPRAG